MKLQRSIYDSRQEKIRDFLIGAGLFIGLNVVFGVVSLGLSYVMSQVSGNLDSSSPIGQIISFATALLYCCPYFLNVGLMIYFGLTRYWIGLGMLGTFAGLLLLVVIAGVLFAVWCFYMLATGGSL